MHHLHEEEQSYLLRMLCEASRSEQERGVSIFQNEGDSCLATNQNLTIPITSHAVDPGHYDPPQEWQKSKSHNSLADGHWSKGRQYWIEDAR
jgi:hypothetical protein